MKHQKILTDTSVFISSFRKNVAAKEFLLQHNSAIVISPIIAAEAINVPDKQASKLTMLQLLSNFTLLELNENTGAIFWDLMKQPKNAPVDIPDYLIAATAIHFNIPVATLNTKDFSKILPSELLISVANE